MNPIIFYIGAMVLAIVLFLVGIKFGGDKKL